MRDVEILIEFGEYVGGKNLADELKKHLAQHNDVPRVFEILKLELISKNKAIHALKKRNKALLALLQEDLPFCRAKE